MLVWVCAAFPSEATFSAWTDMDFCAIWGTSVTSGSFPQYDLQSCLKVCTNTSTLWPAIHCSFVFGVFLKASCLFLPSEIKKTPWSLSSLYFIQSKERETEQFRVIYLNPMKNSVKPTKFSRHILKAVEVNRKINSMCLHCFRKVIDTNLSIGNRW